MRGLIYINLMFLLYNCNASKVITYNQKVSGDTTIVFSKSFHFNVEVLYVAKKYKNETVLSYQINCTDTKVSKGSYLLMKTVYYEGNKNDEWICLLDSGLTRITDHITYRDLKKPVELVGLTEQDTFLLRSILNRFEPPNKPEILSYLNKSIGFAKVKD